MLLSVPLDAADLLAASEACAVAARNVSTRYHGRCTPDERAALCVLAARLDRLAGAFSAARAGSLLVDGPEVPTVVDCLERRLTDA